jgi:hypothetical protein
MTESALGHLWRGRPRLSTRTRRAALLAAEKSPLTQLFCGPRGIRRAYQIIPSPADSTATRSASGGRSFWAYRDSCPRRPPAGLHRPRRRFGDPVIVCGAIKSNEPAKTRLSFCASASTTTGVPPLRAPAADVMSVMTMMRQFLIGRTVTANDRLARQYPRSIARAAAKSIRRYRRAIDCAAWPHGFRQSSPRLPWGLESNRRTRAAMIACITMLVSLIGAPPDKFRPV